MFGFIPLSKTCCNTYRNLRSLSHKKWPLSRVYFTGTTVKHSIKCFSCFFFRKAEWEICTTLLKILCGRNLLGRKYWLALGCCVCSEYTWAWEQFLFLWNPFSFQNSVSQFESRAVSRAHSVLCGPSCQVPYVSGISFPSVHMCFVE